jgi:rare lipoprotein A
MRLLRIWFILALISWLPAYGASRGKASTYASGAHRVQYGVASWYGGRNQGRLMACGEPFNEYSMVAAHRTLPLGTRVRVTNLRNGRSVVVRVMDRGPAVAGRLIDLSKEAANRLRFTHRGLTPVKIRVLTTPKG